MHVHVMTYSRVSNPTIVGGGDGHNMHPFPGGGVIKRAPPRNIFSQIPAGISLVWGKRVHLITAYSIPHPGAALLVTSPMQ